jgi:hypothetical protein
MKKRIILMMVVAVVLLFGGLRLYGAYQNENQEAIERATRADQEAAQFVAEHNRIESQITASRRYSGQRWVDVIHTMIAADEAREYAIYEWRYSANRKLQTKVIALRLWAFLTGTKLTKSPAQMEAERERATRPAR